MLLFDLAVKCFELRHEGNGYMLPFLRRFVIKRQYKEASTTAAKLRLQDFFEIQDVSVLGFWEHSAEWTGCPTQDVKVIYRSVRLTLYSALPCSIPAVSGTWCIDLRLDQ